MLEKILRVSLLIFIFIFPLVTFPGSVWMQESARMYLTLFFVLYMLLVLAVRSALTGTLKFSFDLNGILLLILTVASVFSLFLRSPNVVSAVTTPLSVTTIISCALLYFVIRSAAGSGPNEYFSFPLILSSLVIAGYLVLSILKIIPQTEFTPAGNFYATTIFLAAVTAYLALETFTLMFQAERKKDYLRIFFLVSFFALLPVTVLSVSRIFTVQKPVILPFMAGWSIFLDIFKNPQSLILGVGPSNFLTAYTFLKPLWVNLTPFWNITFTSSSSFLLTIATETGIIALVSLILLFAHSLKQLFINRENSQLPYLLTSIIMLLAMAVIPIAPTFFIMFIIMLALSASSRKTLALPPVGYFLWLALIPVLLLLIPVCFFGTKAYVAEVNYAKSEKLLSEGKVNDAYDLLKNVVSANPYDYRYRIAFSQVSFALANGLSGQKDLKEEDRNTVSRLLEQSVSEAKAAVDLNKTSVITWDNLGNIYSSLINTADGAQDWAIQAQKQKMILDPVNPSVRLYLGGIYYSQNNYAEAEKLYRESVALKRDFANARFNLSLSLIGQKKYDLAYQELQVTQQLTASGSADREIVDKEIEKLLKYYTPQEMEKGSEDK